MRIKKLTFSVGLTSFALLLASCHTSVTSNTSKDNVITSTTSVDTTTESSTTTANDTTTVATTTNPVTTTVEIGNTTTSTTTQKNTTTIVETTTNPLTTTVNTTTAATTTSPLTTSVNTTTAATTTSPLTTTVNTTSAATTTSPLTTTVNTTTAATTTVNTTTAATTTSPLTTTVNTTTAATTTNKTTSTTSDSGEIINTGSLTITNSMAYSEGCAIEANLIKGTSITDYNALYKKANETTYQAIDKELIRLNGDTIRVDFVGLTSGTYDLKLEYNGNTYSSAQVNNVEILSYDRSGYAHFKNESVGAYNNDGSLKSGAVVVYVSDATKNTVTATIGDTECHGISEILKAQKDSNVPLDIRILDEIQAQQWTYINDKSVYGAASSSTRINNMTQAFSEVDWDATSASQQASSNYYKIGEEDIIKYGINTLSTEGVKIDENGNKTTITGITHLDGLTNVINYSKKANDEGYKEFDSYYNELDIRGAKDITIEGIGEDAGIFQWGFCFNQCNSIEVRNLEFSSYTEDAIGIQGAKAANMDYHGFFLHHNTFNQGVNNWDVTFESDKHEGDGSTDFKFAYDLTIAYCKYNGTHKTALIGSGPTSYQYNVTFHHNFYNKCGSRLPFTRNSNFHIYNCYYYGSTGTNMQINNTAYAFIEGCYFENTSKTFTTSSGVIKLWNNIVNSSSSVSASSSIVYADYRTQAVSNTCKDSSTNTDASGTDYSSFDTDSKLFYYDEENKRTDVTRMDSASDVPSVVKAYAGSGCKNAISPYYDVVESNDPETPIEDPVVEDSDYNLVESVDFSTITYTNQETVGDASGIYYYTNGTDSTLNAIQINNTSMTLYDNSTDATTYAKYKYENTYNTGIVKYTISVTPSTASSKWTLIEFVDGNSNILIRTDANKYLSYSVSGSDNLTKILSTALTAGTKYTITLIIDYDNDTVSIDVNGTKVEFSYAAGEIISANFITSGSGIRNITVSDITVSEKVTE